MTVEALERPSVAWLSRRCDFLDPARSEQRREPRSVVALQEDRAVLHHAAAAERRLQLPQPPLERGRVQIEMIDDGHFFAAAPGSLHADNGASDSRVGCGGSVRRRLRRGRRLSVAAQMRERAERVMKGSVIVHGKTTPDVKYSRPRYSESSTP